MDFHFYSDKCTILIKVLLNWKKKSHPPAIRWNIMWSDNRRATERQSIRRGRQDLGTKTPPTLFLPSDQCYGYSIQPKSGNKIFDLDKN